MNIEIRPPKVPEFVIQALARQRGEYSEIKTIFHFVWLHGSFDNPELYTAVGVCGDGSNGAYEWFKWKRGVFTCTNCGYGGTDTALFHALASEASL